MKKINYRQYYYDGDYADRELLVPKECKMFEIGMVTRSHLVKDQEVGTWTKAYALLCPIEFEGSVLLGNVYFNYIDDVFVTETEMPILDVKDAPKFNGVYGVQFYRNYNAESKLSGYLSKVKDIGKATVEDLEQMTELYKESKGIGSIYMLRKLTYTGIEVSVVNFKNLCSGRDEAMMSIIHIGYGNILAKDFTIDPYIAELFREKATEIYKSIVSDE